MPRATDKFYEVKEQMNTLLWLTLGFFKKKSDAEKYITLYNTKIVVKPTKIVERNFTNIKEHLE